MLTNLAGNSPTGARLCMLGATTPLTRREPVAFIRYRPSQELDAGERVRDPDNIIQIHAIHPAVMRSHYDLYREVMHERGPLSRREREILGVRVSALNRCRY